MKVFRGTIQNGQVHLPQESTPAPDGTEVVIVVDVPPDSRPKRPQTWESVAGHWCEERTGDEIIQDIYAARTAGRDVEL